MSQEKRPCPKCGSEMQAGWLSHRQGWGPGPEYGADVKWVEGEVPAASFWTGGAVNLGGKQQREVVSYCCPGCGYLELYTVPMKK
jgi:predicted RNA-binding Zn-ribbon protein involved in translation (DUF1610 family)